MHQQARVQLSAPGVADAVHRPDPAVLGEMWRVDRVPVLGVDDGGTGVLCSADRLTDQRDDVLATAHVQATLGVGEVVLHIHHDQCSLGVERRQVDPVQVVGHDVVSS